MSWLSEFLGLKKIKTPAVKSPEELASMDEFESDNYLKQLSQRQGFTKQIKTGRKTPMLARGTYLGAT